MFWFGPFSFDPASGALARDGVAARLTPQTAQVLLLLVERSGSVVSRAELKQRIWPDTTVEFDQGLSFCIRQLRIALDDDAASPRYIETLPRRGYRFLVPASDRPPVPAIEAVATETVPQREPGQMRRALVGVAVAIAIVGGAAIAWRTSHATGASSPLIAVVPFDADSATAGLTAYRDALAESIVERVARRTTGSVGVLGPSTTHAFGSRTIVDSIRARTGADYALSGVIRRRGEAFEVFAQLIRAGDRAHVWVARWVDSSHAPAGDVNTIGARIADSVSAILLNPNALRRMPR